MRFPLGYSYSHPVPEHTQQNNKVQMQKVSRATEKQFHRKLDTNFCKQKIHLKHFPQYLKNQTNIFLHHQSSSVYSPVNTHYKKNICQWQVARKTQEFN